MMGFQKLPTPQLVQLWAPERFEIPLSFGSETDVTVLIDVTTNFVSKYFSIGYHFTTMVLQRFYRMRFFDYRKLVTQLASCSGVLYKFGVSYC